jgi:hypothetical protein
MGERRVWDESKREKFLGLMLSGWSPNIAAKMSGFVWQNLRAYLLEDKRIQVAMREYEVRQRVNKRGVVR